MSRILSQEEIDALIASSPSDGAPRTDAVPVATFNFRRPDRVSKDQIRSLHFIHDRFARNAEQLMSDDIAQRRIPAAAFATQRLLDKVPFG